MMELVFATILAVVLVLITLLFRRPAEPSNRLPYRGRKIEWC